MRNIVNEYIKMFEENRRARRKTLGVIGILALFVAFGVFWNLHFTGIALTDEVYYCDKEEHEHDEKCYAWMLSDTSADCESTEEAAADVDEIIAADDTLSGEETVQADEVDPEVEAVQAAETETTEDAEQIVESASAEESTQASEMNEEEETEQTKEEASTEEAAVVEETGVSASETDELPAMVLAAEASESEEWYLNRGYVKTLICDKEEHTHTAQCLIDETADVETAEDWEATLPEELGDSATENLVAVAFSQLGYTESSANYIFADDGVTHKGYTRYGAWYGNTYGDWDAMFVAFCLHYAGISEEDFPVNSGAYAWAVQLAEADLYAAADEYTPNVGDLIFLDTDEDGKADLVGIVECVTEEAAEDNDQESVGDSTETIAFSITVILGDYTDEEEAKGDTVDKVCSITYSSTDERILGYGGLEYAVMAAKGLYKQTLTVIVDDLTLTVSGYLSEDANVSAEKVDLELEDQEIQFAIEISIYDADGNEFEPEDDTIAVTVESESITEDCVVYYVPEEGDLEKVTSEAKEGAASFDAEHFSLYAGISEETDSLYDTYMATIAEYEEQAHALETGDDASAVAITSDLGDLLSAVDEDYEAENLTEEEYTEIVDAINVLWDWLEENFDLYGMSTTADAAQGTYNTWTDLGSITNPASVGTIYDIQISGYNSSDDWGVLDNVSSNVSLSGNLFTELYHEKNSDSFMILLDVYKYYSTSAGRGGTDYSTYLDKNPTMKNCGTITISNVGTVNGKSVDISFNIDSVAINSFASYYRQHLEYLTSRGEGYPESYQPGIHYGYLVIATISLGTLANGDTGWTLHMCDSYTGGGEFDRYRIWSTLSNGYAYPCTQTTTLSTKVTYSEDGTAVDSPFLVVSSDLDVTHGGASIANSLYGADYKESFSSLSGFSEYFYYYEDRNNLTITEQGTGKVTVSSNLNTSNLSGETSYLIGGIYGETISGSWTASYKVENCGSIVEVYLPPTDPYTVTIEKSQAMAASPYLTPCFICINIRLIAMARLELRNCTTIMIMAQLHG